MDADSGEVTIVAVGATTITATKAADDNYNEATALYILTVTQTIPAELILGRVNNINLNLLFPTIFNGKTYYHVDNNNDKVSDENVGGIDDAFNHQLLDHLLNNGDDTTDTLDTRSVIINDRHTLILPTLGELRSLLSQDTGTPANWNDGEEFWTATRVSRDRHIAFGSGNLLVFDVSDTGEATCCLPGTASPRHRLEPRIHDGR